MIKCKNLVKTYGEEDNLIKALDNISLEISKGEFVAVIGPSGNGKSTLMHMLGTVDNVDSGEININDIAVQELTETQKAIFRRREIGIVYQFYNLLPFMTVKENILLPIELDGNKVDQNYYNQLIKATDMGDRLDHLPNELSGGEQQRCAIARALINKPSILLADEPTGNLDSKTSSSIIELLKLSNKKFNQTIVMITHDNELALIADRIIKIDSGKIISDEDVR